MANLKQNNDLIVEENVPRHIETSDYNSWGIEKMGLDNAIEVTNAKDLPEVVVAVLDTGCDMDLMNKYYPGKVKETYNALEGSTEIMEDTNGHGTHVSGTIAEGTPDNVKIIPIKLSIDGNIDTIDIINSINYVTYNEIADVMNMSFGGYGRSTAEENAIKAANSKNIITVAAAGNENTNLNHYPSAFNTTISVSSVDSSLTKSSFSNYHQTVDFTAPGTGIKSIMGKDTDIANNNGNNEDDEHETINGTSMATPHVAAAVAVLKSYNKNLTITDTINLLKKHVIDLGTGGKDNLYGYGFVTLANAEFCDGISCDDKNVFKVDNELEVTKIEMVNQDINHIYNKYGNITDLLNLEIKVYYGDDFYLTKTLADLDDLIIDDYDTTFPTDQYGNALNRTQDVTIRYKGKTTTITVYTYVASGSSWQYEQIDEETIRITGIANNNPSTIYIPDSIDGYEVVEIADGTFASNTRLKKVYLPSTITRIGDNAFAGATNLIYISPLESVEEIGESAFLNTNIASVEFSDALTTIGSRAFENTSITSINIPKNVSSIGERAFTLCNNVESITVSEENTTYDSRNNSNAIIETASNTLIKGNYNTIIPDGVETIGDKAFFDESRMEEIVIPDSVTSIGALAFSYNSNETVSVLSSVTIPESVEEIADDAFYANSSQITIYTYINAYAKTYAAAKKIDYETLDFIIIITPENNIYNAFEQISGNVTISQRYEYGGRDSEVYNTYYSGNFRYLEIFNDDVSNLESNGFYIEYENGANSLRCDAHYVTFKGKDTNGNDFEKTVFFDVRPLTPTYEVPNNVTATVGQKLSDVSLPTGFSWKNPNTQLNEVGEFSYMARYYPEDMQNYTVVDNISISVTVTAAKTVVTPNIVVSDMTFSNSINIPNNLIAISNLNSSDYEIVSATLSSKNVGERVATIELRLTDDAYNVFAFENDAQQKTFIVPVRVIPCYVEKPTKAPGDYNYNGNEITFDVVGYDDTSMNISGNTGTNAGSYDVTISLKNNNYVWADGTTDDVTLVYTILPVSWNFSDMSTDVVVDYDGNPHTINISFVHPSGTIIKYKDSNGDYTLGTVPQYTEPGIYTIEYKAHLDNNHVDYYGSKTLTINALKTVTFYKNNGTDEYVTQSVSGSATLRKNDFTRNGFTFVNWNTKRDGSGTTYTDEQEINITEDLVLYAQWEETFDYVINHFNVDESKSIIYKIPIGTKPNGFTPYITVNYGYGTRVDTKNVNNQDVLYTGGKFTITKGLIDYKTYALSVLGDVNGDGIIGIIDYIRIMKHIMGDMTLENEYSLAADMNENERIDIIDYIRIMKIIMGE